MSGTRPAFLTAMQQAARAATAPYGGSLVWITGTARQLTVPANSRSVEVTDLTGDIYLRWLTASDTDAVTSTNGIIFPAGAETLGIPADATHASVMTVDGGTESMTASWQADQVAYGGTAQQIAWSGVTHNSQLGVGLNYTPAAPFAILTKFKLNTASRGVLQEVCALYDSAGTLRCRLAISATENLQLGTIGGGTNRNDTMAANFGADSADTWVYAACSWISNVSRVWRLDGTSGTGTADSGSVPAVTDIGVGGNPNLANDADVTVAWVAVVESASGDPVKASDWTAIQAGEWPPSVFTNLTAFYPVLSDWQQSDLNDFQTLTDISGSSYSYATLDTTETQEQPNALVTTSGEVVTVSFDASSTNPSNNHDISGITHDGFLRMQCNHPVRIKFGTAASPPGDPTAPPGAIGAKEYMRQAGSWLIAPGTDSEQVSIRNVNSGDTLDDIQNPVVVNFVAVQRSD